MTALAPRHPYHPAGRGQGDLRPGARATRLRRRIGYRLAKGLTPAQAARAETVEEAEVQALLADPLFQALVKGYRTLEALPETERLQRLVSHARFLLEEAIMEGDVRAAIYVLHETDRDRDPARRLAEGVLRLHRRAAAPPGRPVPARPVPPPRLAPATLDRQVGRSAANLSAALLREQAVEAAAGRAEPAAPAETPAAAPRPNRRERRRQAALTRRARSGAALPAPAPRDGRPQPRGHGP